MLNDAEKIIFIVDLKRKIREGQEKENIIEEIKNLDTEEEFKNDLIKNLVLK